MRLFRVISSLLLTAVLVVGCKRDPLIYPNGEPGTLTVRVFIPETMLSKAETGLENPITGERRVTTLQIWVFRHGATLATDLIGYRLLEGEALAASGLNAGYETRFTIPLPKDFMDESPRPTVDIYAVVNAASAGLTIDKFDYTSGDWSKVNPSDLLAFTLSGDCFGVSTLTTEVPSAGLPMAGLALDQAITGDFPVLKVSTLTVTRAVSKLRFVFCQMAENGTPVDVFNITGISLSGQIANKEKLFTNLPYDSTDEYDVLTKTYPADGSLPVGIAKNPAPGDYLFRAGMTAQEYEDLILDGVSRGVLTSWGLTYLRETDKIITGEISYTVGTGASMRSKTATFTLDAAGDFARNHSWTIYAYFIGGKLVVQPTLMPWIAAHDRFTFTTEGFTELGYETPWLRYDIDKMAYTWDDTWLVVAYGYEAGSVGKPTHSIMFTLETINSNELKLQLNNDQFILVQMITSYDTDNNPVYSYNKLEQSLIIPVSTEKHATNFYVVPVNDNVMSDPYVKVFLTEMHDGDGLPPMNIPFNHNLPGDEDHTSILIYNPGRAEYNAHIDTHKNNSSNEQATQYWLEEEV